MSKKTTNKLPSLEKAAKQPDIKQVMKEIKRLVPKKTEKIMDVKQADPTVQPPVKPERAVSKSARPTAKKPSANTNNIVKTRLKKRTFELPPEHDKYFVYLKNPLEYRRHLLESSRKIIYCLKSYQKILLIRQKKLDEMKRLKASLKELNYLGKKFNELLPKYHVDFFEDMPAPAKVVDRKAPEPKVMKQDKAPEVAAPREKTELDKLEESLAKIEQKLKGLK